MTARLTRITSARLTWLRAQTALWQDDGLLDPGARDRILARYEAESFESRSMHALVIVALLICAIGLLLLIGYNWNRIPPSAKIAMILAAVAAAFGSGALAYRAGRTRMGESLSLAGTLIYGNAIWLIAQVLHISGHFPDAFLWFGVGALACAWLVRSKWIGVEAAVLVPVWVIVEALTPGGTPYLFLVVWPLALAVGYVLASPVMVGIAAVALAPWVLAALGQQTVEQGQGAASILLAGTALYAAGCWQPDGSRMRRPWQTAGLLVQLVVFVLFMIQDVHQEFFRRAAGLDPGSMVLVAILALAGLSSAGRLRTLADTAVVSVAAVTSAWILLLPLRTISPVVSTLLFSALALLLGVALIRTALRTGRLFDLVFGVLFALTFLVVRWVSLVDDMLLSGLLLLGTGAGLLILAKVWLGRDRAALRAP